MFKIEYEAENKSKQFAWQISYGLTTRTIGVMIMVHGDDKVSSCLLAEWDLYACSFFPLYWDKMSCMGRSMTIHTLQHRLGRETLPGQHKLPFVLALCTYLNSWSSERPHCKCWDVGNQFVPQRFARKV